jgi:hypothetical protein
MNTGHNYRNGGRTLGDREKREQDARKEIGFLEREIEELRLEAEKSFAQRLEGYALERNSKLLTEGVRYVRAPVRCTRSYTYETVI